MVREGRPFRGADDRGPDEALVRSIHAQRGHLTAARRIAGVERVLGRLRQRSTFPGSPLLAFALTTLGLVAIVVWARSRAGVLSYTIDGGHLARDGTIEADPVRAATVRFSDGSEVAVESRARVRLRSVEKLGARLSVAEGAVHVDVVHAPGTHWTIEAGPFSVAVKGTAFTVQWVPSDEQLDVSMARGSVEVSGPLTDTPLLVRAGQHLVVRVRQRETTIRDGSEVAAAEAHPAAVHATAQDLTSDLGAASNAASREMPSSPTASGASPSEALAATSHDRGTAGRSIAHALGHADPWRAALSRGDFESIVVDAERMGIDDCLAKANLEELTLLADAARYGRHDALARRALLAQRTRFSSSTAARDASFLLGRLQEADGDRAGAIDSYDRYLNEAPSGPYASEALGRKMMLAPAVVGDESARRLAEEYLRRFPAGPYAARARTLGGAQ